MNNYEIAVEKYSIKYPIQYDTLYYMIPCHPAEYYITGSVGIVAFDTFALLFYIFRIMGCLKSLTLTAWSSPVQRFQCSSRQADG